MSQARLDDAASMARFLARIPNGDRLGTLLEAGVPLVSRAYDDETWTARFVSSDGHLVTCYTVADVTIDQAEMIAAALVAVPASDKTSFRDAVQAALGPTFDAAD